MNWREASAKLRAQVVALMLLFAVGGVFSAWLSLSTIASVLRGSAADVAVVEFDTSTFMGVPLGVAFFAFLTLGFLPEPAPVKRKRKRPTHSRAQEVVFGLALCCVPLTPLAPLIGRVTMGAVLESRDYRRCTVDQWRRPPVRWVRTAVACPAG